MQEPDYSAIDDDADEMEAADTELDDALADDELTMLAEEMGFDAEQAARLERFVERVLEKHA